MGLITELAITGTAYISVCSFGICYSRLSSVATKEHFVCVPQNIQPVRSITLCRLALSS